jgi:hypothetical protein
MDPFETTLTGSDGLVNGVVTQVSHASFNEAYQFVALDETLYLTIAKDYTGKWIRIAGSEPYFSGWVDELADHIANPGLPEVINEADEDDTDFITPHIE